MKTIFFSEKTESISTSQSIEPIEREKIVEGVKLILEGLGQNLLSPGILSTPQRVADMYSELCSDINKDPGSEITCVFNENTEDLVIVKDIQFSSICEHHLMPFLGHAHIAYVPNSGVITGLSKLARLVESAAKRLQIQERMTAQIADALMQKLQPDSVLVLVEAEHFCMSVRGVKKPGNKTITLAARGRFQTDDKARAEALALIR